MIKIRWSRTESGRLVAHWDYQAATSTPFMGLAKTVRAEILPLKANNTAS